MSPGAGVYVISLVFLLSAVDVQDDYDGKGDVDDDSREFCVLQIPLPSCNT